MLEGLIANAELNPKERDAALWVLGSLAPSAVPDSLATAVAPDGSHASDQVI